MAVVHPSRMNLVPADSRSPLVSKERSDRREDYNRDRGRSRSRERSRRRSPEYSDYREHRERERSDRERNQGTSGNGSMYPPRRNDRGGYPEESYRERPGGGSDYFESRRLQREASTVNIWPPSPKPSRRDMDLEDGSNRHRRRAKPSHTDSEDPEDDRDRCTRRHRRERERSSRKHRTRSPPSSSETSSDEDRDRKRRRRSKRSRSDRKRHSYTPSDDERDSKRRKRRSKSRSVENRPRLDSPARSVNSDDWIEKETSSKTFVADFSSKPGKESTRESFGVAPTSSNTGIAPAAKQASTSVVKSHQSPDDSDDDDIGPQPLVKQAQKVNERQYGGALLKGEGSAMAAFLAEDTNARIPRRGEIGLESNQIEAFESIGYVMSGNRHRRMNAVRIRKENQVISAEEKRGILKLQKEEHARREAILREEFKELVNERLKNANAGPVQETEGPQ